VQVKEAQTKGSQKQQEDAMRQLIEANRNLEIQMEVMTRKVNTLNKRLKTGWKPQQLRPEEPR
jgi:hypothetical protein